MEFFLGDIQCPDPLVIEVTYDTDDEYLDFSGEVFASAWEFWKEVNNRHTSTIVMSLANNVITFGANTSLAVIDGPWPDVGRVGGIFTAQTTATIGPYWKPTWPIAAYDTGVLLDSGHTERAQDGTVYSIVASTQGYRDLEVVLDYRKGAEADREGWINMWETGWRIGRSVAIYFDNDYYESLVSSDLGDIAPRRLIQYKDHIMMDTRHRFLVWRN